MQPPVWPNACQLFLSLSLSLSLSHSLPALLVCFISAYALPLSHLLCFTHLPTPPNPLASLVLALFAAYLSLPTLPLSLFLSLSFPFKTFDHWSAFFRLRVICQLSRYFAQNPPPTRLPPSPSPSAICYLLGPTTRTGGSSSSSFFSDYDLLHTLALPLPLALLPPALPCSSAACSAAAAVAHILSHFSGALHFWCQLPCYF